MLLQQNVSSQNVSQHDEIDLLIAPISLNLLIFFSFLFYLKILGFVRIRSLLHQKQMLLKRHSHCRHFSIPVRPRA